MLQSYTPGIVDFNYQHQIQAIIYDFLSSSNPDYSSWLHNQGHIYKREKSFKLFVFSGIIFHSPVKIVKGEGATNHKGGFSFKASSQQPFSFSFQIASPVERFIQHLIEGVFQRGNEIVLGKQKVCVARVETLSLLNEIKNGNEINITLRPLESPLFVKKPMPEGTHDKYLFPGDEEYEYLLNQNLMHKYEILHGKQYLRVPVKFCFHGINGKSVKQIAVFVKGKERGIIPVNIKGTLQPFTVTGDKELIWIGLECGFGQNNSMGCGYVELVQTA